MLGLAKLILFSHFIVISVSAGVSRSLEFVDGTDLGPTVFYFYKELPFIRYASPLSPSKVLWLNQTNTIALEYYAKENTFFYTTSKGELFSYVWNKEEDKTVSKIDDDRDLIDSMKEKNNAKLLYAKKDWYPRSIALDEVGKKLYIADSIERSIDVFELDGKSRARIFTSECVIPYEIVVDPTEGLLFFYGINFLKRKSELHRMNMDGSDHRIIIDTIDNIPHSALQVKVSLAIDTMDKQLYYKSGSGDVSLADYNGNGRASIVIEKPVAIIKVKNHHLYWFDVTPALDEEDIQDNTKYAEIFNTFTISSADIELRSCDLRNRVSINSSFYSCEPVIKYPYEIDSANAFTIDYSPHPKEINNPCLESDNGCEDLCLLKSSGSDKKLSFGCACRRGRKLNSDGKTCSDLQEQQVDEESASYTYEKMGLLFRKITGNVTNDENDETPFIPISEIFFRKLEDFKPSVVWDDARRVKYTLGKKEEDSEPKKGDHFEEVIIIKNSIPKVTKILAYDWISENLYFAKLSNETYRKFDLFVMPKRNQERKIFLGQIDMPTSMVVNPYRGYLFVATIDKDEDKSRIIRFNTDGSNRFELPYSSDNKIFLTLDMEEDKLYWVDGYNKNPIKNLWSSNLDGSEAKSTNIKFYYNKFKFMTMYREHIFLRTSMRQLFIFNKDGTEYNRLNTKDIGDRFDKMILTKVKVKKTNLNKQDNNPCAINNGGCETSCFAVPANDSKKLQKVCDGELA